MNLISLGVLIALQIFMGVACYNLGRLALRRQITARLATINEQFADVAMIAALASVDHRNIERAKWKQQEARTAYIKLWANVMYLQNRDPFLLDYLSHDAGDEGEQI